MSKLTKRITAMLLAGMLVIASAPGSAFAASTDVDPGQTSEIAEEVYEEDTSEVPASERETAESDEPFEEPASVGETAEEASAEEAQHYTVILDANGGYFENEWDDAIEDYAQQAEVVEKHVPVDGTVAAIPVFTDQDGQAMLFAGWSLERDGELVSQAEEGYVPVDSCVLYAVWQAEDVALGEIGEQEVADEGTEQADSVQELEEVYTAEESADAVTSEESPVEEEVVTEFTEDTLDVPTDAGETSQVEDISGASASTGDITEEASGEEAEEDQYYTVTLNANGGYFENEWDDAVGDYTQNAEVVTKQVPVGGTVAVAPVFNDPDGKSMIFAGWSLERDGEFVSQTEEEYIPVDNCVLYAVWHAQDEGAGVADTDIESADEGAGLADTEKETETSYEDTETEEAAQESEDTEVSENTDIAKETAEDTDTAPETDNEQETARAQEVIFSYEDEEEEETGEEAADASVGTSFQSSEGETVREYAANEVYDIDPYSYGDFDFLISGNNAIIYYYNGAASDLTIPSRINGYLVVGIDETAFWQNENLITVTIPSSVTYIGEMAFRSCNNLKSISIPSSVKTIERQVFYGCPSLESVSISEGVENIGRDAFSACTSLRSISIPSSVKIIEEQVFYGCTSLESVSISEGVESIGRNAFSACTSLKSISIPSSIKNIGYSAFDNCTSLESVSIPEGVESIDNWAFRECTNLVSILIPVSVTSIVGGNTFFGCDNLTIYGYPGSYAEQYATNHEIPFVPISIVLYEPVTNSIIADLNYAAGSFYYDKSKTDVFDWTTTDFDYVTSKVFFPISNSKISFTIDLPDGLSFDPESIVSRKTFSNVTLNEEHSYEIKKIYLLYSNKWTSSNADDFKITVNYVNSSTGKTETLESFASLNIKQTVAQAKEDGLDPASFSNSNQQRNKQIALLAANLSNLMENGDKEDLRKKIISELRDKYGFSKIQYSYPFSENEEESVCASKKVIIGGNVDIIVVFAIQGSDPLEPFTREAFQDWILGNINFSGKYDYHDNFMRASVKNKHTFLDYYDNMCSFHTEKILITGHSRGGAIANLIAKQLIDTSEEGFISSDNIFCYTFAAPNVDKRARDTSGSYGQIYNIINYADIVPFVPGFGLDKYGHNLVFNLNDHSADDEKALLRRLVRSSIKSLRGVAILKRFTDNMDISNIVKNHSMTEYYLEAVESDLYSATPFFTFAAESDSLFDSKWESIISNDVKTMENYRDTGIELSKYVVRAFYNPGEMIKNIIKCPVDVEIIDGSGVIVCSIVNDSIEFCNADDIGVVIIDDKKTISYPEDAGYSIKIIGYDEGTMDYCVYETDSTGNTIKTTEFTEIPVEYGGEIVPEDTGDALLLNTNSGSITADEVLSGNEITKAAVNLSCTEEGAELLGSGTYVVGETVPILAYSSNDEVPFDGWYDEEGNCVSTSEFYAFFVDKDTRLTARYSVDDDILPISDSTIEIEKQTYTGEELKPEPVIFGLDGTRLTADTDYTVSYSNNINVGTASVTITGIGNYGGTTTSTFEIAKASQRINASNLSLIYPKTGTITASGNIGKLTYKSNNTAVATVDSAGKVTAKGAGTAKITITAAATDNYNSATKMITVTVAKATQSITASNLSLTFPNSGKITASGNKGSLSYKSSNTAIATVDSTGKVTAKGAGKATITITAAATSNYNTATKTITVTVAKAAQSITASNLSLTFPSSGKITASGNKGSLSYKSSNTAIATVDSTGKVTAKGAGKATITITAAATSNYNAATKTIIVTVAKAAQSIIAKAAASSVAVGKTTTISITDAKGTKSYKSSDTTIATITSAGKVTAKKVGTVKITATSAATSNYNAASKTVTIKVVPAATASLTAANQATGIKLTWKKVTGANGYKVYRGSTLIKTITSGSIVTYADTAANTNGTKYTYKVVAKASTGDSTLSKSVTTYRVARPVISSAINSAASKMTVKWGKNAKATGYQIQYSTSKSFASGNKTATITSASTVSKVIASLTKGKTYYVRIRTYKTVGSTKYWSTWSASKSVKITK